MSLPIQLTDRIITPNQSILSAIKKMDELAVKSLAIIASDNLLSGILSIGDVQRAIISGISLEEEVRTILRTKPRVLHSGQTADEAKEMMVKFRMEFLPVVKPDTKEIEGVYFWSDFFPEKIIGPAQHFNLPVVIMAGGMGKRLRPLTNIIPKPLIPIGEKTIIEHIFDRFSWHGCSRFFLSVNYKADLIEYYLNDLKLNFELTYFKESKPLGTAGSLNMLKGKIEEAFFVSNCDILIEQDYSEILDYHTKNHNELTIVAALKHYPIPYGIIETGQNGSLQSLIEKPELTFKINSGMYLLEPHLLDEIPEDKFYHITDLIQQIKNRKGRIGVFPVSEKSWKDIGQWADYQKMNAIPNV